MNDKIQLLYNALEGDYNLGSIEDFIAYLQDESKRKMFYEQVIVPRYNVESLEKFESVYGLNVKKKDDSEPVGTTKETMVSTTEQAPAEDISSDLAQSKIPGTDVSFSPPPQEGATFRMMTEEEVSQVEQAPINVSTKKEPIIPQPVQDTPEDKFGIYDTEQDFSAVQGSDISQQVSDTQPKIKQQQEAEAAYQEKINEKFEEIKQSAINQGIIKQEEQEIVEPSGDLFAPVVQDPAIKKLYELTPDLDDRIRNYISLEAEINKNYDDLSDEVKRKIEPAIKRENGNVVGIDYSLLSKEDVDSLIKETKENILFGKKIKGSALANDILENYVEINQVQNKIKIESANNLRSEIEDIQENIKDLSTSLDLSKPEDIEQIKQVEALATNKINEYNRLSEDINSQQVELNAAEIAAKNTELGTSDSVIFSAVETLSGLVVQELPILASLGLYLSEPFTYSPALTRTIAKPKEEALMKWSVETKNKIEEFVPTDTDDVKANFVGNVLGQIGFVVGNSLLGATPLAMLASGTMSMGEMYEEAIENGLSHDDAMNLSVAYGTVSAPLEFLGAKRGIEALAGKSLRKTIIKKVLESGAKDFTKDFAEEAVKFSLVPLLKETLFEGIEEGLQEGTQYLISKGLAETYNALKEEDKPEFIKAKLWSNDFWKELKDNVVLGSIGGKIGGATLNVMGGNVFVGNEYKTIEKMFLDADQMSKIDNQLRAYRRSGKIETDEDLQLAREQVGIVQSAAAEVNNATKTSKINEVQKKKLFQLTAERLSLQKEIEGVTVPALVSDKKKRIEDIDKNISNVISGKITIEDILAEQQPQKDITPEVAVEEDSVVSKMEITDSEVEVDEKVINETKRVDNLFNEKNPEVAETLSDNLVRNKSADFELSSVGKSIVDQATKAAKAIQRVAPNVRVALHDTTKEYTKFAKEGTRGTYDPSTKTIHIDLSKANNKTVGHETFHSILLESIKSDVELQTLTDDMYKTVNRSLATNPFLKRKLRKFSEKYADNLQSEEALSEFFGMLSSDYKKLSAPVKIKIKQFINKVATKFGLGDVIKLSEQDLSDLETIELLNTMAARVKEGEAITEEETKPLTDRDVKEKVSDKRKEREQKIDVTQIRAKYRPGKRISKGVAVKGTKDKKTITETEDLSIAYVKKEAPKAFIENANILAKEDIVSGKKNFGEIKTEEQAQEVYDVFTREVADNLIFLTEEFNQKYKDISTLWYDGANILAQDLSKKYDVSVEQVAGIIASLSPQKDWYQNVRLAELTLMAYKDNPVMTQDMVDFQQKVSDTGLDGPKGARRRYKKSRTKKNKEALQKKLSQVQKVQDALTSLIGTKIKDADPAYQAYYVRLYTELNVTKDYNILRPDGEVMQVATKKDGTKSKVAWGSYVEIGKGVSIYNDGSQENITKTLGEMHKIRNFYNNIIDPMSQDGDVTIDTHAVAAGLLKPLSGNSREVGNNFGTGTSNSGAKGVKGVYYAYSDAYALAAEELGLLPRQVQSITWEAVRGLYTDSFKRDSKKVKLINDIWEKYRNGKITTNEARNEAIKKGEGINDPTWAESVSARIEGPVEGIRGRGVRADRDIVGRDRGRRVTREQKDDQIPEKTKNRITKLADRLKSKFNKDTDPSIILEDVLANLQRLDTWYETANDTQRENAVRFARKYLGFKEIRTPKIADYRGRIRKIFSLITDVTKIDLEQQIEIARELKKRDKLTKKEKKILDDSLNEILKELEGEGKLTTSQVKAVIRKFQKIDVFSPSQVDSFVDYMTKVFADADYMAKIKRAESKLSKARNNIKTKTGINEVGPVLYKLFRINPRLIPSQFFETYLDLVNTFSENKKELNPKNLEKTMEDGQAILNYLNVEATKLDWLSKGFNDYVAENKIKNKGFKEIVGLMKKEGIIDDTDQEIMLKYQSVIDPSKRPKKTEQEIQEEKDELVKDIKDLSKEKNPMFSTNDEKLLAEKLKNQIKRKSIDQLSLNELKTLLQVISNINQGLITNNALQLSIKLDSIQDSKSPTKSLMGVSIGILTKAYNKVKASISDKNYIQKTLESSPLYYLDMVLGDGKSTVLYDSLFRKLATAEQRFNYDMRKIRIKIEKAQNNVKKSLKGSQNALIKSSAKQYLYMLELEYLSNADKTKVKKASQYLEKTIDEGKLANRDIEMLEDIRDEFVIDGDVDMKKLFDSFNKAERESIKVSQEINSSLSDKAMYTAGVIRGQRIDLLNNYVHHIVTSDKFDGKTIDDGHEFMQKFNNSLKPSTKAKTLVERQNVVTALNFDIYNSVNRGSKLTLLDYHLSVPIKTARMTMRQVKANLEEEGVYKNKKEIYEGINSYLENTIETFIFNNISSIGGVEMTLATIAKIGYQRALVDTGRMVNEIISNFSFILNYGRGEWSRGMRHRSVDQEVIAEAMNNLGSLALGRLYSDAGMRSRFTEKITSDNPGVKGKKNKSKVVDVLGVINYYTFNRGVNAVDSLAEKIVATPDQMMSRPLWNGAFDIAFEKETGQKFPENGFERIAANDQAFMSKYKDALKVATRKADDMAIEAGSSSGMFTGITRGKDWKTNKNVLSGGIKFLFSNFNNYMTTFMTGEYMAFRKGLNAAMGNGAITRKEGRQLMAAVTTRMTLYTWLGSLITKGVVAYLLEALGLREEEPEDKEGKDTKFLRSFVQTGLSLFVGRNFGNMTKGVQNLIIEDINEKYLDILRDGEYGKYKNSLAYTISPSKKPYETTQLQDYITPFAGPFGKLINSANAAIRVFQEKDKKEKDAKERQRKRKYKLFFSDIPAALGLLPLSKEVEKEFNNWIYNDLKYESKQKKKEKKSGEETYPKAFNISDLKEVAPELYEELKAIEDETKAIEKEIKDDLKSD